MLFEDTVNSFKELIEKGKIIIIDGILRYDDYLNANRITGEKLLDIDQIIESKAKRLTITLVKDSEAIEKNKSLVNLIKKLLQEYARSVSSIIKERVRR
jgi:DNA polymerase III alpha subunit